MPKKKPTKQDALHNLGPHAQTGRKPKKPATIDARLDQLIKDSESWNRQVREAWFDPGDPLIEDGIGATICQNLPDFYADAIETIQWLRLYAEIAEEKLRQGKRKAEKKRKEAGG